ncbi:MAG: uroporphyrinogen-III C-methyltransferase [Ilumatobacteraceae bacterium]
MPVYLVGAGPGDPELITVKAARLLAAAEVVVHDRLVHPDVVAMAPASAERISAAKAPRRPTMTQDQINDLLVERGRRGQMVVRLKGGDPFIFARGGEEADALAAAGVPYEIVPGISSALAAPPYAGIPTTYRHEALSVTIVTGHEDPVSGTTVDWEHLAGVGGTIIVLMGAGRAAEISARLVAGGLDPDTPAATVRWATYADQEVTRLTLAELGRTPVESPSVMVIGTVARRTLDWVGAKLRP